MVLALAFEIVYAFLTARMNSSVEQGVWTGLYWLVICLLGFTTGVIPHGSPPILTDWFAFFLVAIVHLCMNLNDPGVLSFHRPFTNPSNSQQTSKPHNGHISVQNPPDEENEGQD